MKLALVGWESIIEHLQEKYKIISIYFTDSINK